MEPTTNPRQLEYHPVVGKQIQVLNQILAECGVVGIFDNPDITFDQWWIFEHTLKFRICHPNHNSVTLDFWLQSEGMRIDFEGNNETCEFTSKEILEDEPKVIEVLVRLICCPILVETKGNSRFVNLFNSDGSRYDIWVLQSFVALITGGYWKPQTIDQHLFDPIYPQQLK